MNHNRNIQNSEIKPAMVGNYCFDPVNLTLSLDGNSQRITVKESKILWLLASTRNRIVTWQEIMISVWGEADYYTGRSLDVFISKIRSYLKNDPRIKINTIPTVGYMLKEIN
jgi:DNA-binding response OmpR family regulator